MEPDLEQGYKLLFEKHPQPMFVVDRETLAYLAVNEAAIVRYGYTRDEFSRMTIADIRPAEDVQAAINYVVGARPGLRDAGIWRHKKKDGTIIEVNLTCSDVVFGGREARLVLAEDVTERRRVEDEVRQATSQLHTLFLASPLAIITLDRDGLVTSWNEAAERLFGWTGPEVLGRPLPYVPEGQEGASDMIWESVMRGEFVKEIELRRKKKDGSTVDINLWVAPLRDAAGQVIVTMGLIADITERKQTEEALRKSQAGLARAQHIAHLGNWEWDLLTNDVRWSDEIYRMFGLAPDQFGASYEAFLERVHPDDRPAIFAAVDDALKNGTPYSVDHRIILADGTVRIVSEQAEVVRDDSGKATKFLGTVLDITERKRMEEELRQSQKIEVVGQLAGGVAHDFNNLLTGILGYSNLLLSRMGPQDPLRPDVEEIQKAGERAAALTRQLLAFGRRQVLQPVVLDLNQIVVDLDRMLRRLIGEHIELVTLREPKLGRVKADPGQVQQVIMNLVVNARDAMPDGGRLTIETANTHSDRLSQIRHGCVQIGPYVMVAVTDTGSGMDAETQQRMFEPFFTTKESGRGTGLGLSTVYGIVMQSGGCLKVHSSPGRGSRFEVHFPQVEADLLNGRQTVDSPAPAGAEVILLVEDGDVVRNLARVILERNGYTVLEAANGEEALILVQRQSGPIHLVLTDVVMPRMNGPDLVRRLSPLRPDIRILYMSGHAGDEIPVVSQASGRAFLQKPFTPASLASKVREVLDAGAKPPASP